MVYGRPKLDRGIVRLEKSRRLIMALHIRVVDAVFDGEDEMNMEGGRVFVTKEEMNPSRSGI